MDQGAETPAHGQDNAAHADSIGSVVQAGTIEGGVHYHQPTRPVVALPHRAGIAPPRALSFQDRADADELARVLDQGDTAVLTSGVVTGLGVWVRPNWRSTMPNGCGRLVGWIYWCGSPRGRGKRSWPATPASLPT
ncbi:hypothetical protein [Actinocrispum wychmicini]|uniref:hypothetical protein n=1 Tax=Actinocrispum wychmicini TaxID=1213861 RepID=UPI001FB6D115|nr:hypothetical protein [Actinocrispum wychmicini]